MTVEADIVSRLGPLVSNKIWPDIAPLNTVGPYLTFQQVGGEAIGFLGLEKPSKKSGRFQINTWTRSRLDTAALMRQVEDSLITSTVLMATAVSAPTAIYDNETKLYGAIQDFYIWFDD